MDIFQRLDEARLVGFPFPHIVLEEAIDSELCRTLIREMPPLAVLSGGCPLESNKRFTLGSTRVLSDPGITAVWKEVIRQGMSQAFLDRVIRLFAPEIRKTYPDFVKRFGHPERLRAVARDVAGRPATTLGMDAQIAVNTPALREGTTVRSPHLDWTAKLFVGLVYLRVPEDKSTGADLELYKAVDELPPYDIDRSLPADRVRIVGQVPYRSNTMILFLNTPWSLHGVSPRQATSYPRYFLNLVGETTEPLFQVPVRRGPQLQGESAVSANLVSKWYGRLRKLLPLRKAA